MSHDPRAPRPTDDDEQEINLGRHWQAVVLRWWLVLALVVAGIVVGYLATLGGGRTYRAEAVVYLGQPLTPGGGAQVSSPSTQLALVDEIARAESTLRAAAAYAHTSVARLRGNVTTKAVSGITGAGKAGTAAPIAVVTVVDRAPLQAERATAYIAQAIVNRESGYVDTKIEQLNARLVYIGQQITRVQDTLALAEKGQQQVLAAKSLGTPEQALLLQNYNNLVVTGDGRLTSLEQDQFTLREFLKLAQDVEHANIETQPKAISIVARSRANSIIVGAIIGLLLGIVAALVWEPVMRRAGRKPA